MGAVSSCCSLISIRSPPRCLARFSLSSSFSFPICAFPVASRPCRLVGRLVIPSRLVRPVLCRVVRRAVLPVRLVGSSRLVVSYGRRSVLLVARSCSPIRSRFMSSVVGRGCASWAWGGRGVVLVRLIRPIICSYSLLVRSLLDGYGDGWIWGAVPCCSPLVHCLFMPHRSSHLIGFPIAPICVLIPSSEAKKTNETETGAETQGNKTRRPTRRRHETKTRDAL